MRGMTKHHHHENVKLDRTLRCGILTISDTRKEENDSSGLLLKQQIAAAGHLISAYRIVPDDPTIIASCIREWVNRENFDVLIATGGTGIASRDSTLEAVFPLLKKEIPGFGELFRSLSFQEIGPRAMLSRAFAGLLDTGADGHPTFIFCVPGSTNACRLAAEKLILPQLTHIVAEMLR